MNVGAIGALLAGSKLRLALVIVLAVGVTVGGAFAAGIIGVPGVAALDHTFGDVTGAETTIETDLVISNPNPFGIGVDDVTVNYTISMNAIEMAHGQRDGIHVGAGNSTIDLETTMANDAIPPWWTSHIQNGERTEIGIDATVTSGFLDRSVSFSRSHAIETNLIGSFNSEETRPVNADSALTDDPVLYINETRGAWGDVTDAETPIDMAFVVSNPNLEPYAITELGYEITMNDVPVGSGESHDTHVIGSGQTETIPLTTTIENDRLDEWWVTHLDETVHAHQVTELRIEFYAVIELPSGTEITVPLDEFTYEETIETDIFDEGADVRNGDEDDNDGAAGDTDESEDGSDDDDGSTNEDGANGDDSETDDGDSDEGESDDDEDADDGEDDDEDADDGEDDDADDDGILPL